MWVEKTKNGLRICERYEGPDGKTHRTSVPLSKNTAQARKLAAAELQEKIRNHEALTSSDTFARSFEIYLSKIKVKETTRTNYRIALDTISEALGPVQLSRLSVPIMKRALGDLERTATTKNQYITILNTFLKWAHEYGYIEELLHVSKFPEKEQLRNPELEYLERDELEYVLKQLAGSMCYYVCKFLALTGCRVGEMSALTPEDIDGRYIHINKAWTFAGGVQTPKTATSCRDIFITPELAELLRSYKEWRLLYIMAHKIRPATFFFTSWGSMLTCHRLSQILRDVDCPKHLHPHIFRHTHVSLLAEQGVSLETISRRLGHSTSQTTRDIYFHVTQKLKARDEEILARVSILG